MRTLNVSLVIALSCAASFTIPAASAGTPQPAAPHSDSPAQAGIWVVGAPSESFHDQVLAAAVGNASSLPRAKSVVTALLSRTEKGQQVTLAGPSVNAAQETTQLQATLADLGKPAAQSSQPSGTPAQSDLETAPASPPSAGHPNAVAPNVVGVRGSAINNRHSWTFNEELRGEFCDANGCTIYDDIRQRWTMDPGRTSDRFSFTSNYSPNSGNFTNVYVNAYVDCNGDGRNCGFVQYPPGGPRNGQGSGVFYVGHFSNAGGTVTDEVDLFAHFGPTNQTRQDDARTGAARCQTGSNTSCLY